MINFIFMRYFIYILIFVYGLSLGSLSAQNLPKAEFWVLDSEYSYTNDGSNQWVLEKKLMPVQRNYVGFLTVGQEYYDADLNGNWQKGDSIAYQYYNGTKTAEVVNFPYVNGAWDDTSYCVRYDTDKRRTFKLTRSYDYTANPPARRTGTKWYYFYTVSGKDSLKLRLTYDGSAWRKYEKYVYEYDANDDMEDYTIYKWNGSWEPYKKYVYYRNNQVLTGMIAYRYNSSTSQWGLSQRTFYYYNSDNTLLQYETLENRNTSDDTWEFAYKTVYEYDNDSILSFRVLYSYNSTNSSWEEYRKYEYHHDVNGNLSIYKSYAWDGSAWKPKNQTTYVYNQVNYMIEYAKYVWDNTVGDWEKNFRKDFFYSKVEMSHLNDVPNTRMRLYPNPTPGPVRIEGVNNPVRVEVYSLTGSKIAVFDVSATRRFDIQLLPQGYYFIKVLSRDKSVAECKLLKL